MRVLVRAVPLGKLSVQNPRAPSPMVVHCYERDDNPGYANGQQQRDSAV